MTNRRTFIKSVAAASALTALLPLSSSAISLADYEQPKKIKFKDNAVILFQGDSITDGGRDRENQGYNNLAALGNGYVSLIAAQLLYSKPTKNLKIFNRGISGNKVYQLAERWEKDCLAIKPDILTVMIGVNDFWHTLTNGYTGTAKTYRDDYIKLLTRTKDNFPDLHLIVMEPFGLKGVKAVDDKWYPSFLEYQQITKEVAGHFNAAYIPLQDIFNQAAKTAEPAFWTRDGVHPTIPGSAIISRAWLSACV
ncbi:MAG: lysophospholipase [Pedobacter sp.]|nr:MAG: lysophospholipase [Pedobacter sp.]